MSSKSIWGLLAVILIFTLILTACGDDSEESKDDSAPTATTTPTPTPTDTPAPTARPTQASSPTPAPTSGPSATPQETADLPAIELLSGAPETCAITEGYSVLVGYEARYYETTTEDSVAIRLLSSEGEVLLEAETVGENKDGEEGWGWYPDVYAVPENSALTIELTVHDGPTTDAPVSSISSVTYNCTTGEILSTSFQRN
jgi:hypothetical protein